MRQRALPDACSLPQVHPVKGNVAFSAANSAWSFTLRSFAQLYLQARPPAPHWLCKVRRAKLCVSTAGACCQLSADLRSAPWHHCAGGACRQLSMVLPTAEPAGTTPCTPVLHLARQAA